VIGATVGNLCATNAPSPATVAPTIAADDAMSGSDTRRTSAGVEYGPLLM
jgi:hypothetical protein